MTGLRPLLESGLGLRDMLEAPDNGFELVLDDVDRGLLLQLAQLETKTF